MEPEAHYAALFTSSISLVTVLTLAYSQSLSSEVKYFKTICHFAQTKKHSNNKQTPKFCIALKEINE